MTSAELVRAKHRQAADLLPKHGLDCWIVQFARETGLRRDPLEDLVGMTVTWPSAFLLRADGTSVAIVATGDQALAESVGVWQEIRPYTQSPREQLCSVLDAWAPAAVGVTWHESDPQADGITHGMLLMLRSLLDGTPHAERLRPAGALAAEVRRRKLPVEIEGIARAVAVTEAIFDRLEREVLRPGAVARQVQAEVQRWIREAGHGFAWEEGGNPMVDFGPPTGPVGHLPPGDRRLEPGDLVHVDLGVVVDGFASDLQRVWYLPRPGETAAPAAALAAFETVVSAIDAAVESLAPGVPGHEVDAALREVLTARGCWDPPFAAGHHVGRVAHDGGGVLGPRWERYGDLPDVELEEGNVFAVETGMVVEGVGMMGLEENVVLESGGPRYLSHPQRELRLLRP